MYRREEVIFLWMEVESFSEMLCSVGNIKRWTESGNTETLIVTYHCQNREELVFTSGLHFSHSLSRDHTLSSNKNHCVCVYWCFCELSVVNKLLSD
jgi:hypothetical protein